MWPHHRHAPFYSAKSWQGLGLGGLASCGGPDHGLNKNMIRGVRPFSKRFVQLHLSTDFINQYSVCSVINSKKALSIFFARILLMQFMHISDSIVLLNWCCSGIQWTSNKTKNGTIFFTIRSGSMNVRVCGPFINGNFSKK